MDEPAQEPDSMVHMMTRNRPQKGKKSNVKGNRLVCTHCGEEGHSKSWCYEIIGYPDWWDFNKKPRKKVSHATVATSPASETTSTPMAAHTSSNTESEFKCRVSELAKNTKVSYVPSINNSSIPFVTFIDEYNGGENFNNQMKQLCRGNNIKHQTSCVRTPQQNGLAERRNRQILEIVRASLFFMKVKREYWGEAVRSAAYLMYKTPSSVIDFKTPLQKVQELSDLPVNYGMEPRGEIRDEAATPNKILEPDEDNWLVVDSNLTGIHEEGSDLNFRDEGNYEEEDNSSEKFEVQESNVLDLQDESLDVKQDSTDPIQVEEVNSDGVYG
ncbi:uncharacterized protein LOC111890550 [Lactuca sativa]|uniref:uncharacterized protein LOC111890550 n=1 Tax=Lactuca sativa TaxID=4236 RepID=UPI000CD8637A|nr:uncharacterized protein LOC111890550 [Lactuca sativa]